MIELVDINTIQPSTYNPRKADARRLDLIELSLSKLGFLLPIYADENGEILSGHQRHYVAMRMGWKEVPVFFLPPMELDKRKAINIMFNRGTNDLRFEDTPTNLTEALEAIDVQALAKKLPELGRDVKNLYPCMHTVKCAVATLTKANEGRWINYAYNMARSMSSEGISQPVIVNNETHEVVNGIGRLQLAAEKKMSDVDVVYITPVQAAFSSTMLNNLSMDFDIHNRYRDLLRYNSFRRGRLARARLGWGFIFNVASNTTTKEWDVKEPANAALWRRTHGRYVCDFGAGHLYETNLLKSIGVNSIPFEPYRIGKHDEIDKEESLRVVGEFLEELARGKEFDSVFISSVLNSVPFVEDREHIACILAALCGSKTRLYAWATNTNNSSLKQVKGYDSLNDNHSRHLIFSLEYESNITIGDLKEKPKVQKYHTSEEFYELFKKFFDTVKCGYRPQSVYAICANPVKPYPERLAKALEFEFDLPYPDGSRMGMVKEAKVAFSKRLGIEL